ncbi:MAG: flagellar biogenesis protein FliO [Planctomycetota bacterium]|jgi:flagellar biogenesis protein FliO
MSNPYTRLALLPTEFGGAEGPDFTRYLVICGLLILAIAGAGLGFRRLIGGTLKQRASARSLGIIDVLPMGGKKRLCVVRCYDRTFVVAQGDRELSYVAELDAAEVPERPVHAAPIAPTPRSEQSGFDSAGFEAVLDKARARMRTAHENKAQVSIKPARRPAQPAETEATPVAHQAEMPEPAAGVARPKFESLA